MNLEEELRDALRPEPPPPGFAGRVISRAQAGRVVPGEHLRWRRQAALAIAAGFLAVAVVPAAYFHQKREQQRAEAARDQLRLALAITQEQLQRAKEIIRHNSRH